MKQAYIRFMAAVDARTTDELLTVIDRKIAEKCSRIHLMISSPGGSVFHGLSIYNFLKGAPFEVYSYNFGTVDSIGVVVFCAGQRRYSVPNARFLIHGVRANLGANSSFDEGQIQEMLKGLMIDQKNIARVIAENAQLSVTKVEELMNARTTWNPSEANEHGLVHEIKTELFPIDADLTVIREVVSNQFQGPLQFLTQPQIHGFTGLV